MAQTGRRLIDHATQAATASTYGATPVGPLVYVLAGIAAHADRIATILEAFHEAYEQGEREAGREP